MCKSFFLFLVLYRFIFHVNPVSKFKFGWGGDTLHLRLSAWRLPFASQNHTFCVPKPYLLQGEMLPLARQKVTCGSVRLILAECDSLQMSIYWLSAGGWGRRVGRSKDDGWYGKA